MRLVSGHEKRGVGVKSDAGRRPRRYKDRERIPLHAVWIGSPFIRTVEVHRGDGRRGRHVFARVRGAEDLFAMAVVGRAQGAFTRDHFVCSNGVCERLIHAVTGHALLRKAAYRFINLVGRHFVKETSSVGVERDRSMIDIVARGGTITAPVDEEFRHVQPLVANADDIPVPGQIAAARSGSRRLAGRCHRWRHSA